MGQKVKLSEIQFDPQNANEGSERGRYMIETSLREFGFADAGTLDRNNMLIGGNKRTEVAGEIGMEEAIIVDVDGALPVFIRRNDLDLTDPQDNRARRLAYFLNRSQEVSLTWDSNVILKDAEQGIDFSPLFREQELSRILDLAATHQNTDPGLATGIGGFVDLVENGDANAPQPNGEILSLPSVAPAAISTNSQAFAPSHRIVQLFLITEDFDRFTQQAELLQAHFGLDSLTDAIVEAVKHTVSSLDLAG